MRVASIPPDAGEVFVAKQCDHCGKILPNDTIRYCPGCGKLVASSRPAKRSLSEDPPAWMKQLETSLTSNRSKLPLRELNVKVWEGEETRALAFPAEWNRLKLKLIYRWLMVCRPALSW